MAMEHFSIGYALLAVQIALGRAVTPGLRAVDVDICKESQWLYLYFFYDGEASEHSIDLWQCATTEGSAYFGPDCDLSNGIERWDHPKPIPVRGRLAYFRREPNVSCPVWITSLGTAFNAIQQFKDVVGCFICPVTEKRMRTTCGIVHGTHVIPARPLDNPIETVDAVPVSYALLAVQRAFLSKVTDELRAIIVDACEKTKIFSICCYYHGQITDELMGVWRFAIVEASAAMGSEYTLDASILRLDYPERIPFRARCAYSRYEKPLWEL